MIEVRPDFILPAPHYRGSIALSNNTSGGGPAFNGLTHLVSPR